MIHETPDYMLDQPEQVEIEPCQYCGKPAAIDRYDNEYCGFAHWHLTNV